VKGRLDSVTLDALRQAIDGVIKPEADEGKSLGQRQADALGELCEHVLDGGRLPGCGGENPHLGVTLSYEQLERQVRGGSLTATGLRIGPKEIRRIACDSQVIALVLGGHNEVLDVGRERRTATKYQRRALTARDGGCAHPGCTRPPSWCSAHHITHWAQGGRTDLDNLVFLCLVHHRMVHQSGWTIRMRDHLPAFIPPRWIDINRTPRRKPILQLA
jgi:5-methylcytosine-specific restriction protein A